VSQGLGSGLTYDDAADYTAALVDRFRSTFSLRRLLRPPPGRSNARVLNINFPTCTSGSLRGVRAVVLGRAQQIVGYDPAPGGQDVWQPVVQNTPIGSNDCTSVLVNPKTDLEAMSNGFASVTPLNADLTNDGILPLIDRFVEE
jgi:broad specificity polyphosphatase/5'/3'-nucleotidase SurE